MFEYGETLFRINSIAFIKKGHKSDKYGNRKHVFQVFSVTGDILETFAYDTIEERDTNYTLFKNKLDGEI